MTETGDCIIGVDSDFDVPDSFLKPVKVIIELIADGEKEIVKAFLNPHFTDEKEIVIRKTDFLSERTLAIHADKACVDFSEKFREKLRNKNTKLKVNIEYAEKTIKKV